MKNLAEIYDYLEPGALLTAPFPDLYDAAMHHADPDKFAIMKPHLKIISA